MNDFTPVSRFSKGTVVISIDDGNADDFRLYENILSKLNLSATFNVVTDLIDGEARLTKEQLRILYEDPRMEIAAHGHTHRNDGEDIRRGVEWLREWLPIGDGPIGFASPGSEMKADFVRENEAWLRSLGLLYVRTSENGELNERHIAMQRRLEAAGASSCVVGKSRNMVYAFETMCVHSVVVVHDTAVEDLMALADLAVEEKACLVFMFHKTRRPEENGYDNTWCYDYDRFATFAEHLAKRQAEGVLDVCTNRQVFEMGYIK